MKTMDAHSRFDEQSWFGRWLRWTMPSRLRRTQSLVLVTSLVSDGSPLTENAVFFFDDQGRPLFEGFGLLSWNGWQEKQKRNLQAGARPYPWKSVRHVDGWSTYCVYNPYIRLEDYLEISRRHARDVWGRLADDKRIELRMSAMSQTETNQEVRRQMALLLASPRRSK